MRTRELLEKFERADESRREHADYLNDRLGRLEKDLLQARCDIEDLEQMLGLQFSKPRSADPFSLHRYRGNPGGYPALDKLNAIMKYLEIEYVEAPDDGTCVKRKGDDDGSQ